MKKIAEIAAAVSATAFILTVIYAYGFSIGVDVNLIKYFSINDYIRLSVYWLPKYIFFSGIGYCVANLHKLWPRSPSKKRDTPLSDMSAFAKFVSRYGILIPYVVVIGATIATIIRTHSFTDPVLYPLYCLLAMFTWGCIFRYTLLHKYIKEWAKWKRDTLICAPIISIIVFCYGALSGQSGLDSVDKHPTSQLEMITEVPIKNGKVLLVLTQYIVFMDQKIKMIEIIPVGQVKDIIPIPEDKGKEKKNKKQLDEVKKK